MRRTLRRARVRRGDRSAGAAQVGGAGAAGRRARGRSAFRARTCASRWRGSSIPRRADPGDARARHSARTWRCCAAARRERPSIAFPIDVPRRSAADAVASAVRSQRLRADQSRRGVAEQALAAGALRRAGRGDSRAARTAIAGAVGAGRGGAGRRRSSPRRAAPRSWRRRRRSPTSSAIAKGARLMVSGDTGPLHIAAAVGTPIVALFGPTRAERNGPWSPADIVVSRIDAVRRVTTSAAAAARSRASTTSAWTKSCARGRRA